jgi:hypothetical protein
VIASRGLRGDPRRAWRPIVSTVRESRGHKERYPQAAFQSAQYSFPPTSWNSYTIPAAIITTQPEASCALEAPITLWNGARLPNLTLVDVPSRTNIALLLVVIGVNLFAP